jgi:hypothetical protein
VLAAGERASVRAADWNQLRQRLSAAHVSQQGRSSSGTRGLTVFTGDWAIPQFVDGGGWQTSLVLANLDTQTAFLTVYFIKDDGTDMQVPVVGLGNVSGINVTLPPNNTINIETEGSASALTQGWAVVFPNEDERFGGFAVFRQRVQGRPDFEAVVPIGSILDQRMLLIFDNTRGFTTGMAIANPDTVAITVNVTIRDDDGNVLGQDQMNLGELEHTAFTLPSKWPVTAGKQGSIEFSTTSDGVSVLGLRFNSAGAFTSFHTLSNVDWSMN